MLRRNILIPRQGVCWAESIHKGASVGYFDACLFIVGPKGCSPVSAVTVHLQREPVNQDAFYLRGLMREKNRE